MSLDVYLEVPELKKVEAKIFIRRDGANMEITREEWDEMHPGFEPAIVDGGETSTVFHANITHNLGAMAEAVGLYKPLWRPEEIGITKAAQLIVPLREGLARLVEKPVYYEKAFTPKNGWGSYNGLVAFVTAYLAACEAYPAATVIAS